MAKRNLSNRGTRRGYVCSFKLNDSDCKISLIDGGISFYKGIEMLKTIESNINDPVKFADYCYGVLAPKNIKKSEMHFTEI